ncbi:MAG: LPS export ABC transporter periplasmic protein LptC [Halanaerobiales bacterium]|nr:LPS export ABC transporter periplasmic protein LptC [Halanaerobiales bacterium]
MQRKNFSKIALILLLISVFILTLSLNILAQQNLTADQLIFEQTEEGAAIIEATGNVKMDYNEMEITGNYAKFEQNKQIVTFEGNVKMVMETGELTSDNLRYEMDNDYLEATGNVLLQAENYKVESNDLTYNRSTKEMNFTGQQAYIEYDTITANADRIKVLNEENKAVLSGNVSGQQRGNKFKADQIEILNNGDKIEMTGSAQLNFESSEE